MPSDVLALQLLIISSRSDKMSKFKIYNICSSYLKFGSESLRSNLFNISKIGTFSKAMSLESFSSSFLDLLRRTSSEVESMTNIIASI